MGTYQKERDVPRHLRRFRVEVNGWRGTTVDVSLGGFAAEMLHPPRLGSEVRGSIEIGKQSYTFSGRVVWVVGGDRCSRVGVRFSGIENLYLQSFATSSAHPL